MSSSSAHGSARHSGSLPTTTTKARPPVTTKERLLTWRVEIEKYRVQELAEMTAELASLSQRIRDLFAKIQGGEYTPEDLTSLDQQMNTCNQLYKSLEHECLEKIRHRFAEFASLYPSIFDLIAKGDLDDATFAHVLETFDRLEKGQMSQSQGFNSGLSFMKRKYKLPDDFFQSGSSNNY